MNNRFTYHGLVQLTKIGKNGKALRTTVHNAGTVNLFKLFALALAGRYNNELKPTHVAISQNTDTFTQIGALTPITGLVYKDGDSAIASLSSQPLVKLSAAIPYQSAFSNITKKHYAAPAKI